MKNEEKKSPLTDRPLRNPGQSIDEAIDKLIDDKALSYIVASTFFIALSIMEWVRWYNNAPYSPILYSIMALLVTGFSAFKLVKIKKKLENLKLGRDGERAVGQFLENLRENGYKIFHDIVGEKFNIDHVVISKHGIFTIETKTYSKPKKRQANIRYDGLNIFVDGHQSSQDILVQARAEAHWLKTVLKESSGKEAQVKPVVVFPGWYVESDAAGFNPDVWVLNPKALSKFISKSKMNLSDEDVALFSYNLSRYIRATHSIE
jgi:hypothetical protein